MPTLILLVVLLAACAVVAEALGTHTLKVGSLRIVLLPLLTAFIITAIINIMLQRRRKVLAHQLQTWAGELMPWLALIFVFRAGLVFGENLPIIIDNGTVMLIQSIGKIGTILAFPLAIAFGMEKAAIGATFTIGREPSLSIVQQRYGLSSPEMTGALSTYVAGTIFGALFFSILAALGSGLGFSTTSLVMACGAGSGGMTFSCAGSLAHLRDDLNIDMILALATASDVLSYLVTILLGTFLTLPLLQRLMSVIDKRHSQRTSRDHDCVNQAADSSVAMVRGHNWMVPIAILPLIMATPLVIHMSSIPDTLLAGVAMVMIAMLMKLVPLSMQRIIPLPIFVAAIGVLLAAPRLPWGGRQDCI